MTTKRQYQQVWNDLMDSVEAGVEAGECRDELLEWAYMEYDSYSMLANSETDA